MLHDLCGEESAKRRIRQRVQIADRVRLDDVEAARTAGLGHLVIEVDPLPGDAGCRQQLEELSAPAADVQDVRSAGEERQVALEPGPNQVSGTAELILESEIFVGVERRRERRTGYRRCAGGGGRARGSRRRC